MPDSSSSGSNSSSQDTRTRQEGFRVGIQGAARRQHVGLPQHLRVRRDVLQFQQAQQQGSAPFNLLVHALQQGTVQPQPLPLTRRVPIIESSSNQYDERSDDSAMLPGHRRSFDDINLSVQMQQLSVGDVSGVEREHATVVQDMYDQQIIPSVQEGSDTRVAQHELLQSSVASRVAPIGTNVGVMTQVGAAQGYQTQPTTRQQQVNTHLETGGVQPISDQSGSLAIVGVSSALSPAAHGTVEHYGTTMSETVGMQTDHQEFSLVDDGGFGMTFAEQQQLDDYELLRSFQQMQQQSQGVQQYDVEPSYVDYETQLERELELSRIQQQRDLEQQQHNLAVQQQREQAEERELQRRQLSLALQEQEMRLQREQLAIEREQAQLRLQEARYMQQFQQFSSTTSCSEDHDGMLRRLGVHLDEQLPVQQSVQQSVEQSAQQPQVQVSQQPSSSGVQRGFVQQQVSLFDQLNGSNVLPVPVAEAGGSGGIQRGQQGVSSGGNVQPTLVPSNIKLEKPPTFSGKSTDVQNFIFAMRQYIQSVNLGDGEQACRFAVSFLRDSAFSWWRMYALSMEDASNGIDVWTNLTLDVLLDEIEEQFSDVDRQLKLRQKLLNIRQIGSVQSYTTLFRQLQVELGQQRLQGELELHVYIEGLKPKTKQQVLINQPPTLGAAILLAQRVDRHFSEYQQSGNAFKQRGGFGNQSRGGSFSGTRGGFRSGFNGSSRGYSGGSFGRAHGGYSGGFPGGSRGGFRGSFGQQQRGGGRVSHNNISQYGNTSYAGNVPMVMGNVQMQQQQLNGQQCHYCGKTGHFKRDCFKYQRDQQSGSKQSGGNSGGSKRVSFNLMQNVGESSGQQAVGGSNNVHDSAKSVANLGTIQVEPGMSYNLGNGTVIQGVKQQKQQKN